jgi:CTP-dependent riboflavin kinase
MKQVTLTGVIATGLGQATGFTGLDWARAAFIGQLGIDPYPGTINLLVGDDENRAVWAGVRAGDAIVIHPPRTDWCDAHCYKAIIAGQIEAAIVLPLLEGYPVDQIELIAAVNVRDALGVEDGDRVTIEILNDQGGQGG